MMQRSLTVIIAIFVLVVGLTIVTTTITSQAYARTVHIRIYGHGSVMISGKGHIPDVVLHCLPALRPTPYGYHHSYQSIMLTESKKLMPHPTLIVSSRSHLIIRTRLC